MRDWIRRLREQRDAVHAEAGRILDRAEHEGRDLSSAEKATFNRLTEEQHELDERVAGLEERSSREAEADRLRAPYERLIRPAHDGPRGLDPDLETLFRTGAVDVSTRGLSVRVDRQSGVWELRDLDTTNDSSLVPVSFRRSLYEHLIENSAIRRAGATILRTDSGEDLVLPKTTAHPLAGTIVAEAGTIGENDPTFGQGTLEAHKYASLVQVTSELLQDSGVDLSGYLSMSLGRALANGSGADFVIGTGSSEPQGVLDNNTGGSVVTGGTGVAGAPTADEVIDVFYALSSPYRERGTWLMSSAASAVIRKLKTTDEQYLWTAGFAAAPDTLLGRPVVIDPNVPDPATSATSICFGDFSAYYIREVGLRIEQSRDFAFDQDLVTMRAISREDGIRLDDAAFAYFKGGAS